jgi:ATP-binding cassette subfamily B multidrug efflux pump
MDKGRIVEMGTHGELAAQGGLYSELWARQSGGFIDDGLREELKERQRRKEEESDEIQDAAE